jgi:hypothetical protein
VEDLPDLLKRLLNAMQVASAPAPGPMNLVHQVNQYLRDSLVARSLVDREVDA